MNPAGLFCYSNGVAMVKASIGFPFVLFILGIVIGSGVAYILVRLRGVKVQRVDGSTYVCKLPLFGSVETDARSIRRGVFVKDVIDDFRTMEMFRGMIDIDTIIRYAREYNLNYIGFEGDRDDGTWSDGKLACSTLSKGRNGGYNIFLNPGLDRVLVSQRLSVQLGCEISPDELYTFLFLHEIGHSTKAGNECYISAMVNHSLSGGRRSAKRRKMLKDLRIRIEQNADTFALRELAKLREKGRYEDALTEHEGCRADSTFAHITV